MYQRSDLRNSSGDFRISASIDKVKYVFVYLQRDKTNVMTANPYIFDTFKLNAGDNNSTLLNCRLEYGNESSILNLITIVIVKVESFQT